jgi:hypothetical protein
MFGWKILGWVLIAAALLFAAAETAAQALRGEWGIMAAARVVEILLPNYFDTFRDLLALIIFQLPGWLLLGAPGVILALKYRAIPLGGEEPDDEIIHTTYEDIVASAEEADEWISNRPSKYSELEEYDPTNPLPDEEELEPYQLQESDAIAEAILMHEGLQEEKDEADKT